MIRPVRPAPLEGEIVRLGPIGDAHMLVPDAGVRDSAYHSVVDDEGPAVRQSLSARPTRHAEAPAHA